MQKGCDTSHVEHLLIATQCDLEDRRQVSKEQGEQLACTLGIPFFETSAKTGYNVNEAFETHLRLIMNRVRVSIRIKCVCDI